jgi:hypothetical protein
MTIQEVIQNLQDALPKSGNLPREIRVIENDEQDKGEVIFDAMRLIFTINKF